MTTMYSKRKMGRIESAMTLMHEQCHGSTQVAHYLTISTSITKSLLEKAAKVLFDHYESLRARVSFQDDACFFISDAQFADLEIGLESFTSADALDEFLLDVVTIPLDSEKILWRLVLVEGPEKGCQSIVFVFHHSILDGDGFFEVSNELLMCIDKLLENKPVQIIEQVLPDPVDVFLKPRRSSNKVNANAVSLISHEQPAAIKQRTMRRRSIVVEEQQVKDMAAVEGVKVNSIIASAVLLAAYDAGLLGATCEFKSAVSLRSCLFDESISKLGCYIGISNVALDLVNKPLMNLAKDYEFKLMVDVVEHVTQELPFDYQQMKKVICGLSEQTFFNDGVGITNMGVIPINRGFKHFDVVKFSTVANRLAGNTAFVVHVFVFLGKLHIDLVYTSPLLSEQRIESVRDKLLGYLKLH